MTRYFGNGGGRDSYIINDFGGMIKGNAPLTNGSILAEAKKSRSINKIDRLFGRLPDQDMMKMTKALIGD